MNKKQLQKIQELAKKEAATLQENLCFLVEEIGEIALAMNVQTGIKKRKLKDTLQAECVDALICLMALFYESGGTEEELNQFLDKKLKKWKKNLE